MKKFTFMLLTAFIAVAAMAAGPQKRDLMKEATPFKPQVQLGQKINAKQAPKELVGKIQTSTRARAPKKAATAADLVGDYTWDYETSSETSTDPESLTTTASSAHATISESTETEDGITISGMFSYDLEATLESDESGDYITIAGGQLAGTSSYGNYVLYGLYYYEGDEENSAGWYYSDIHGYLLDDGSIYINEWLCRVLSGGQYDGYTLTPYYVVGSTLTPSEPLTVVTLPEGVEANEYVMTYDGGSTPVNVAVDGNDVYFQGMSYYIPEAWVKGTKDVDNKVTFAGMQYVGEAYGMTSFFFYNGETVFTYDPDADTYSAEGEVFGVLGEQYYDGNYTNPVIAPVTEKAVMPADPEITSLKNGSYGWYFDFNVPLMDINGDPLVSSKLYYMIYTDVEGEIAPLTFTPATHSRLEEDITEIPYGFTEDYDFYDTQIYLNDLYNPYWNKIGIQSIYYGADEENATEIQWYTLMPYKETRTTATFDFNAMDVPTSNATTDGDITENTTLTEDIVSLTISPAEEGKTANRYWSTNAGPQLRVYSGTLSFSVPAGYAITQIVFNNGKWNAGNTADSGEFESSTWTGEAQNVVVTIAGNSQINSINVTVLNKREDAVITVSDAGYATFVAPYAIEFTGSEVSAFAAQAAATYVHLEPVTAIPAGTAVVVEAAPGTYNFSMINYKPSLGVKNDLTASAEDVVADGTQYVLAQVDGVVGFYQVNAETTIAAGKGYLVIEAAVKAFYPLEDGNATGIESLTPALSESEGAIYNLAGQRINKMQKGINIVNGKKVLK